MAEKRKPVFLFDYVINFKKSKEWSLVLKALNIPFQMIRKDNGYFFDIDEEYKEKAEYEVSTYEIDNVKKVRPKPVQTLYKVNKKSIIISVILFFIFQVFVYSGELNLTELGKNSADYFFGGDWYRLVTSLTLHADFGHLLSNMIFGAAAVYGVSMMIGSGAGWFLILVSGIYGNMANNIFYGTAHNSVGASTAVFGGLGIIMGLKLYGIFRDWSIKLYVPIVMAVIFFALLGVGGARTDVMAHFFGMLSGGVLGLMTSVFYTRFGSFNKKHQYTLGISSIVILLLSWLSALL